MNRRGFLKTSLTASTGAALALSFEEQHLITQMGRPVPDLRQSGDSLPMGRIKDLEISRLFCGGNLIGGWAHSRDLLYVSPLVKAYHTDEKVFETLALAESQGINAILTNPVSGRVINEYWKRGGTIQWFSDCALRGNLIDGIRQSVENGAHACYVQGGIADAVVRNGQVEVVGEAVAAIRALGVPAGIGAHSLETIKACVQAGLDPDFWVKTLHRDNYFSATPKDERVRGQLPPHDNMWCTHPEETIAFMRTLEQPWIAFKVLAAGAIRPEIGFRYAFEQGADFICVGMFDFQVVEDVTIAREILSDEDLEWNRPRPWRACCRLCRRWGRSTSAETTSPQKERRRLPPQSPTFRRSAS